MLDRPRGRFADRVAIVTGAAKGIGRAVAGRLASEGAHVVVADRDGAEEAANAILTEGLSALGVTTDVSSDTEVERLIERTKEVFGACNILVNNAAIATSIAPRPFDEIPLDEWRRVFEVNVLGIVRCCRAATPGMSAAGQGRIINIASAAALKGIPFLAHYVSSKGAVFALTKSLARELGHRNILVNSVAPGFTLSPATVDNLGQMEETRGTAMQGRSLPRDMYPADVIGAVMFFAGDDAGFITGQTLVVDGGTYLH
jgi:NAD(P)-dependent dehydrogenase (short-subunit alcohol dehydrogenase family)